MRSDCIEAVFSTFSVIKRYFFSAVSRQTATENNADGDRNTRENLTRVYSLDYQRNCNARSVSATLPIHCQNSFQVLWILSVYNLFLKEKPIIVFPTVKRHNCTY